MNRNDRQQRRQQVDPTSILSAYSRSLRFSPEVHEPSILKGGATPDVLRKDFTCWLSGVESAVKNPHILQAFKQLPRSSERGIFNFLQGGGETVRMSGSSVLKGERERKSTETDDLVETVINEYDRLRRAA